MKSGQLIITKSLFIVLISEQAMANMYCYQYEDMLEYNKIIILNTGREDRNNIFVAPAEWRIG